MICKDSKTEKKQQQLTIKESNTKKRVRIGQKEVLLGCNNITCIFKVLLLMTDLHYKNMTCFSHDIEAVDDNKHKCSGDTHGTWFKEVLNFRFNVL